MYHRVAIIGLFCGMSAAAAEPVPLSGKTLNEIVPGASVHLDTPLGTKLPVKYTANGLISGEAGGLAWFLGSATDRGRWWVTEDKLCQKFFKWFDAEVQCLRLKRDGDKLYWSRDDGKTGTATLIAAAPIEQAPYGLGHPASALAAVEPTSRPPQAAATAKPGELPARTEAPSGGSTAALPAPGSQPRAVGAQTAPARAKAPPPTVAAAAANASPPSQPAPASKPAAAKLAVAVPMVAPPTMRATSPLPAAKATIAAASPQKVAPPRVTAAVSVSKSEVDTVLFRVSGVHPRDVLNVRQGPSTETAPVGVIPPFAEGVVLAGACQMEWCPVRHGAVSGWVNRYYLREED